jgi:K+-sensing histidine kinase KdpD
MNIIVFIISKKKPQYTENLMIFLILFYTVGLLENSHQDKAFWNDVMYFVTGINLELVLITPLLSKSSWIKTSFISILINLLGCFRYTDFSVNQSMKYYPLAQFIGNMTMLCLGSFLIERYDRKNFQEVKNYELSLSFFKNLIENTFPSAVIITSREGNILFKNEETSKIFENERSNEELLYIFSQIKLEATNDEAMNTVNSNNSKYNKEYAQINASENDCFTLRDAIKYGHIHNKKGSVSFFGNCEKLVESKQNLEIKISNIFWEKKQALMIIVSENKILQRLKDLNEQAAYKDRLLATVSHDLRTPLNGITGMISLALDLIQDLIVQK